MRQSTTELHKAFSPAIVTSGHASTLTITLTNPNATAANLTAPLINSLPSGMVVSGNASTTCGGTLTAGQSSPARCSQCVSSRKIIQSGASIPAHGSCTVTVDVIVSCKGTFFNKLRVGALQTDQGSNAAPATASLAVKRSSWWW